MKKLLVGRLCSSSIEADLLELFVPFGPVLAVKIVKDGDTHMSRGYGFVELENDARATAAAKALNGARLDGRDITVREAKDKPQSEFYYRFSGA